MNNYCRNCGEKLTNQDTCEKCGTKVLTLRKGEVNKELEKKYIWAFVIIIIVSALIPKIIIFDTIISFIYVIYAKRKLKYSVFFNVVFWISLVSLILFILFIIFMIVSCEYRF